MARKVIRKDKGPKEIPPQAQSTWICMCGLSKNQPFCDGSHKQTQDEDEKITYVYNADGTRTQVVSTN